MIYSIIILIIVGIKAIFSAADTALTYINRAEIRQLSKTDKKAKKIRYLMEESDKFFGTIEVAINLCELFAGSIVSITILEAFMAYLEQCGLSTIYAMIISVTVVTIILAYIMFIFGAILPKRIAKMHPKKTAYRLISILWIIVKINYPFEKIIDFSAKLFSRILGIDQDNTEKMTEQQLKLIIKQAKEEGVLEELENKILMNTMKANDIKVSKIMIPIEKAYCIDINDEMPQILEGIRMNKYSRIPVYEDELDKIIGVFNLKDTVINHIEKGITNKKQIKEVLREPIFIEKDEKIFSVFKVLQKNKKMLGIVLNDDEVPVGIITVEDILEKLVGKIFDEDDS